MSADIDEMAAAIEGTVSTGAAPVRIAEAIATVFPGATFDEISEALRRAGVHLAAEVSHV